MDLITKAKELNQLQADDNLFSAINNLNKSTLDELVQRFDHQDIFRPVNFLRYLVAWLLQKGEKISRDKLEELKISIQNRRVLEIYPEASELFLKNLNDYKTSDKGMFPQWREPFPILYQFFYSNEEKQEVIHKLKECGNEIIQKYSLENAQVHAVGFDGPQNYGSDISWGAVIPSSAQSVQHAFQIFFSFNADGVLGGIYPGHKITNIPFRKEPEQFESWDEYLNALGGLIPKWKELNSKIDFSLQQEENELSKRIKSFSDKDVNIFFNVLDWLISDLELADLENLVFSTGSKQLSFHVGKRYCLVLDKKGFYFIVPEGFEVPESLNSSFDGSPKAGFVKETSGEILLDYYPEIANAVQVEIDRDNHAKEKNYDNAAFRKAAFEPIYRSKFLEFKEINRPNRAINKPAQNSIDMTFPELNQIFFGPPGTGKTFSTISEAVKIADPEFYQSNYRDRDKIKSRFNSLLLKDLQNPQGQIAFCTFHQSFSYEDFVEGIKPELSGEKSESLKYVIEDGIFKIICELAESDQVSTKIENEGMLNWPKESFKQASFWKISLGDTSKKADSDIYDFCIRENKIALGFTREIDFTNNTLEEIKSKCVLNRLNNWTSFVA
ncbi:5-methylcytosine-specific restriction endonuclease subunit McrB [Algoriphagus formosus]|uniref:hypothetical protein n=1 Tax=Algoriphagus formosus TaxID=2007308 RepID=UPI000C293893|nr:hypothetical protein [Algoriphagus formosus]